MFCSRHTLPSVLPHTGVSKSKIRESEKAACGSGPLGEVLGSHPHATQVESHFPLISETKDLNWKSSSKFRSQDTFCGNCSDLLQPFVRFIPKYCILFVVVVAIAKGIGFFLFFSFLILKLQSEETFQISHQITVDRLLHVGDHSRCLEFSN